jgi:hypothetical protein
MQKKLQVFISSTFKDLQEERQAAVEAVLNSGHIPAGMELFKSGDKSQKETIKRWIEESDVYMLILGGRYGSIEEESGKSYTHWEYDYAGELGKPRFAIVIEDSYLDDKVKNFGKEVIERDHPKEYEEFKVDVLSKMSKFYSDIKDIKLTVLESLKEFERNTDLSGWVSGKDVSNHQLLLQRNFEIMEENIKLKAEIESIKKKYEKENEIGSNSYAEIRRYLRKTKIKISAEYFNGGFKDQEISLMRLFLTFKSSLDIGIENQYGMDIDDKFCFFQVAPKLMTFNLVEKVKVAGKPYQRIQTSKEGRKFLSIFELEKLKSDKRDETE